MRKESDVTADDQAVLQVDKLYQKALENYPGNVVIIDKEANVLFANESAARVLDITRDRLLKMNYHDILEKGIISVSAGIEALKSGEITIQYSETKNHKGMYVTAVPVLNDDGNVENVFCYSQNDSEMTLYLEWVKNVRSKMLSTSREIIEKNIQDSFAIASSGIMQAVLKLALRIAPTAGIVLINGESGTGKEVLAHYIHKNSKQKEGIFLAVNCAAIPEELAESEFFGYESGAFTGARKSGKAGYFEVADGGTLFLDEVGELSLSIQAKLLRVLESRQITRIGGSRPIDVTSRILCATNRDLKQMVQERKFREDLYYRLDVLPLYIPPLRQRKEDILPLAEKFLLEFNVKNGVWKIFSEDFRRKLQLYDWPGNVRELRNMIERAVIISQSDIISSETIVSTLPITEVITQKATYSEPIKKLKDALKDMEQAYLEQVLTQLDWDIQETSLVLNIHPSGLYKKIKDYGLKKLKLES